MLLLISFYVIWHLRGVPLQAFFSVISIPHWSESTPPSLLSRSCLFCGVWRRNRLRHASGLISCITVKSSDSVRFESCEFHVKLFWLCKTRGFKYNNVSIIGGGWDAVCRVDNHLQMRWNRESSRSPIVVTMFSSTHKRQLHTSRSWLSCYRRPCLNSQLCEKLPDRSKLLWHQSCDVPVLGQSATGTVFCHNFSSAKLLVVLVPLHCYVSGVGIFLQQALGLLMVVGSIMVGKLHYLALMLQWDLTSVISSSNFCGSFYCTSIHVQFFFGTGLIKWLDAPCGICRPSSLRMFHLKCSSANLTPMEIKLVFDSSCAFMDSLRGWPARFISTFGVP